MTITIHEVPRDEVEPLIPLLRQAEESEAALRWSIANLSNAVYYIDDNGRPVGAATMQWRSHSCEIMELAIAPERHGQGLGKQLVAWLIDEARRRGKAAVLVGTANSSIGNIAFYQKCGFRMDHIRKDYFRYYSEQRYEDGLPIRDLLVFKYELVKGD